MSGQWAMPERVGWKRSEPRCGTRAGAMRHRKLGEPVCGACAASERDYMRLRRGSALAGQMDPSEAVDVIGEVLTGTGRARLLSVHARVC